MIKPIATLLLLSILAFPTFITAYPQGLQSAAASEATYASRSGASSPAANDPILYQDAKIQAVRATVWQDKPATSLPGDVGVQWLSLDSRVRIEIGGYGFSADRAVVRIETLPPSAAGQQPIRHLALYLENAKSLPGQNTRGPASADAPRLLVTASIQGQVNLITDAFRNDPKLIKRAQDEPFYHDALGRINRYLSTPPHSPPLSPALSPTQTPAQKPAITQPAPTTSVQTRTQPTQVPGSSMDDPNLPPDTVAAVPVSPSDTSASDTPMPYPQAGNVRSAVDMPIDITPQPSPPDPQAILPATGTVIFHRQTDVYQRGENFDAFVLIGDVTVVYQDFRGAPGMTLQAENVVVFLNKNRENANSSFGPGESTDAGAIAGIYLEENVIVTDGDYTVRAPRVYYDPASNRAMVLDAVMYTWNVKKQLPIYVRAEQLRQKSKTSWSGKRATITTSEFGVPHFAIAASKITLEERRIQNAEGEPETRRHVTASNMVGKWGPVPVFYWPYLSGDVEDTALRRIKIGGDYDDQESELNVELETTWDLFGLMGTQAPDGVTADLQIDWLDQHKIGLGTTFNYDRPAMRGRFEGYLLPEDDGFDRPPTSGKIEQNGATRGYINLQHRQELREGWELTLEGSYVSDELFLAEFFDDKARNDKPFETLIYLKKQENDWALDFLAQYDLIDFMPQLAQLQAPGYQVDRLPELGYYREGTSLWNDRITWYSENRISRVRIAPGEDTPGDRGLNTFFAMRTFGIADTTRFDASLASMGVPLDWVNRFDSRQEIQAPFNIGTINAVPYAVGRVTAYDDDFKTFNSEADDKRLWGQVGMRFHTQISKTNDAFDNRALDLHRMRHIIEPSVDISLSGSTVNSEALPVYDPDVESLVDGGMVRVGMRNTWQTQRGGSGRWRSVDWLVLDTDVVMFTDDAADASQLPRYYGYRPEFSMGSDHFHGELLWMVSDAFSMVGEIMHDLQDGQIDQWRIGGQIDQNPRLSYFAELVKTKAFDDEYLSVGMSYQLTSKYKIDFSHSVRLSGNRSSTFAVQVSRKLPRWRLAVNAAIDDIEDTTSFSVLLIPDGVRGRTLALPSGN